MKFILFLALSLFLLGAFGELICEELAVEMCTLSIASNGKRCVLESRPSSEGKLEVECQTSEVFASNKVLQEYIETDECVGACGIDRQSLGLSSDAFLDSKFIAKLCSHQCYTNCPNIIDLYSNVASAEGVPLTKMCSAQKIRPRRGMSQLILSSGAGAPVVYGGGGSVSTAPAPVSSEGSNPVYEAPVPVVNAPAPVVGSNPVYEAPAAVANDGNNPVYETTAPVVNAPAPVSNDGSNPVYAAPAPVSNDGSNPVYEAPAPVSNDGSGGSVSDAPPPDVNDGTSGPVSDEAPPPSEY